MNSRINSLTTCDAGRWLASASAMKASRSSGSSFMVNTASLDMTGSENVGVYEVYTTSIPAAMLPWAIGA